MHLISVDLEIGKRDQRILALAAVDERTGAAMRFERNRGRNRAFTAALAELEEFCSKADCLVGHNLIAFDIPHLQATAPELALLRLPVLDTLRLSPLAFPANPYHRLVKHYQDGGLVRGQVNNPELDARLTLDLLAEERDALRNADPDLLIAWHWLTARSTDGAGFDGFFAELRDAPRPTETEAHAAVERRLAGHVCATHGIRALAADEDGWPMAFALAWLSVAGGNSVMPPWVRHQFPAAGQLVKRLRDVPCENRSCAWCRERHDAARELRRWFGFERFRADPATERGTSMQQAVVETAMRGEHAIGLLPTGAGKSLCYQVPALSRYDKTGALTVVISPLVALMADQVAGLEARGISSCVTVNGMLSMPERADALDRVRLGDAAIILISPEQLRNRSLRRALDQREIGAWVLDEAHCLSRWGHDFRPDYRYIGRYIKDRAERLQAGPEAAGDLAPILCLTATAKPDVVADIHAYFHDHLGIRFTTFDGGARRDNLDFVVVPTETARKLDDIFEVLMADLPPERPGGAIVYCATRKHCEDVAEFLRRKDLAAAHFHAGLLSEAKKDTQQRFINGDLRVIAATNAFGMGIDKPDVRLVIHADIPGSLENYLQEAGRAGRDRQSARCVLLYTTEDVERQFGMSARSRLTRREIHGILRALRNVDRKNRLQGEVVATPGEILVEDEENAFERDNATDDTRVKTAVAWLEEAALVRREENRVQVFPSSLQVQSVEDARERLAANASLTEIRRKILLNLVQALITADPDEGISTDELMGVAGLDSEGVRGALYDLEHLGIARNDTALTAFVHVGTSKPSRQRLEEARELEIALIDHLREAAPDLARGERSTLHLRVAAQSLKDAGLAQAIPERLLRIVRSISQDGRGDERAEEGSGGSIDMRRRDAETVTVTLRRNWRNLAALAERRRGAARLLLDHLVAALPESLRGADLLAETTLGALRGVLEADLVLKAQSPNLEKLLERALLWLHEQEVIRLNKGLAVFRPAMTIHLAEQPEPGRRRRGFIDSDFEPLKLHYREQVLQIHVMAEFAARGLEAMADAVRLAMDYFSLDRGVFLERWLPDRQAEIARETTPEAWRAIVEELSPAQRRIVADDREQTNVLVLAGPGSGKTRVLVHRIAYLVRVRRQNPRGIVALAYNRHAALEIRRRLAELIGDDARGVTVMTCHALAMRLVGASFAAMKPQAADDPAQNRRGGSRLSGEQPGDAKPQASEQANSAFARVLKEAIALLRGEGLEPEEADTQRERLLAGFRWILVDEYQDIDPDQYELISALAGRSLNDDDSKLTVFAVGDDDQNIYSFMGASVEFIRRFESDYSARRNWLTENYRSTAHIIDAANAFIEPARRRIKAEHPIEVDRGRRTELPGGDWAESDPVARGRVQVLPAGDDDRTQALAAIGELRRLESLAAAGDWNWRRCAVIARNWRTLDPVGSLCELEGIPAQMANDDVNYFWRLRETRRMRDWLAQSQNRLVTVAAVEDWLSTQTQSVWMDALGEAVADYRLDAGEGEHPVESFREWLAEWGRELRRRQNGLLLLSAHRAKGLEFDHVVILDGDWRSTSRNEDPDAWRRLFYVAMTRARKTLAIARFDADGRAVAGRPGGSGLAVRDQAPGAPTHAAPLPELRGHPAVVHRRIVAPGAVPAELDSRRETLGLADVNLSFPGRHGAWRPIHDAIRQLRPGDELTVRTAHSPWELALPNGPTVCRLARQYQPAGKVHSARVHAIVTWNREDSETEYRDGLQCDEWEVVVPQLVFN